ncbi:MAG: MptD family putative ECF transporter S component [Deltaproteobacteria bacterium]|nr:MptD family putative ECF transporter S component [Deltaproteobacteria bacterium]
MKDGTRLERAFGAVKSFLDGKGIFETHELVTIGLFAAGSRAATLMIALVGGGMNPVTIVIRSAVHAALLVVLLCKVPKTGALTLFNVLGAVLAFFLMGQGMLTIPAMLVGTLLTELAFRAAGGLERRPGLVLPMVAASELMVRFANLGVSWLAVREQPGLMVFVTAITAFSYLGILIGLPCGWRMARELRHAGLIR